jgi:hypothetical protein
MTRKRVPYKTGDWFGVPLRNGGFAVGVVARAQPRKGIVFGYFFGPRRETLPEVRELHGLKPANATLLAQFGDLGLLNRTWPIIGSSGSTRENWPMPRFVRRDAITGKPQLVTYGADDPSVELRVRACDAGECVGLPEDGVYGYGAVEIKLTDVLEHERVRR